MKIGGFKMKFGLALLAVVFLGLTATACTNSPVTPEYNYSAIEGITTLENVVLVVPTIF